MVLPNKAARQRLKGAVWIRGKIRKPRRGKRNIGSDERRKEKTINQLAMDPSRTEINSGLHATCPRNSLGKVRGQSYEVKKKVYSQRQDA